MKKFLVIQTAFIGDAILATAVLEKLYQHYPNDQIDYMVRKGNEGLFDEHSFIQKLWVWDKKNGKYRQLLHLFRQVRQQKYDYVINLQRFASTGFFTAFSGAKHKIGFQKNPLSFLFTHKIKHQIKNGVHETDRNQRLIEHLTDSKTAPMRLYPTQQHADNVAQYQQQDYICVAPASVWFTKQFPPEKWIEFLSELPNKLQVYYIGATSDYALCEQIKTQTRGLNLAGKLNLLESAALMKNARMNYVNDSAPLHLASAVNANTTAIYCSTVPEFGFGPKAEHSFVVETSMKLACRPCNLHGKKQCPEKHFACAMSIKKEQLTTLQL